MQPLPAVSTPFIDLNPGFGFPFPGSALYPVVSARQIRRASNSLTDSAKKLANVVSRPIKV